MESGRVLVVGLDGATFRLLGPMIAQGRLPHLAAMIEGGTSGTLLSSIPELSPPAWTSFLTGKNPGRHRIFGFFRARSTFRSPRDLDANRPVNAESIGTTALWRILNRNGRSVGFLNVPVTYPPQEVDGFMISGILTPSEDSSYSSPPSLKEELLRAVPDYRVRPYSFLDVSANFIEEVTYYEEKRLEAALYLFRKYEPDFFMVVFDSTDTLQHRFWPYLEPSNKDADALGASRFRDLLHNHYQAIDTAVGDLARCAGKEATVIVMSDHGFSAGQRVFYINRWLHDMGLLRFQHNLRSILKERLLATGVTIELLRKLDVLRLRQKYKKKASRTVMDSLQEVVLRPITPDIDWQRTRAYSGKMLEPFIYINLMGREETGVVNPGAEYEQLRELIIAKLSDLTDPETGERVFAGIHRREELYEGEYASEGPDVVLSFADPSFYSSDILQTTDILGKDTTGKGIHAPEGIFVVTGTHIRRGHSLSGARIVDVAPTILYAMGLQVPTDIDGQVLTTIFEDQHLAQHAPQYEKVADFGSSEPREDVYSEQDVEKIEERLRGLGYLS